MTLKTPSTFEKQEYNPFEHRSKEQKSASTCATFMHLLKMAIGSGILFLPAAFKNAGYVTGFVCSILVGTLATYTAITVIKCSQVLCKKTEVPSMNFAQTAAAAFYVGPRPLRKYSNSVGVITDIFVCLVQYQTTVVYALYVATSLKQLLEYYYYPQTFAVQYILLCLLPLFIIMSLVPNLKYLVPFSIIASICLSVGVVATFYYFIKGTHDLANLPKYTDVKGIPVFCAVFLFALYNTASLFPLENSMKQPEKFPKVIGVCMGLTVLFYIIFGFFGFLTYPSTRDTVIKDLNICEFPAQLVKIAITLSVLFSYGFQYFIPFSILWPMVAAKMSKGQMVKFLEVVVRITGVTLSTIQAILLPNIDSVLGLLSAIAITTVMFLIPIAIDTATHWYDISRAQFRWKAFKNSFIFLVYIMVLVVASYDKMIEVYEFFRSEVSEEKFIKNCTLST